MFLLVLGLVSLAALTQGQCPGYANVVVAVPAGLDVPPTEFDAFEANIIDLLNAWQIDPNNINIGLLIYASRTKAIANPRPLRSRVKTNTRVSLLSRKSLHVLQIGVGNNIAAAIDGVADMLNDAQANQPVIAGRQRRKIGIVFQYGWPETTKEVSDIAEASIRAGKAGILMYAVNANATGLEFQMTASDRCRTFLMNSSFSQDLRSNIPLIASSVCSALDSRLNVNFFNCIPQNFTAITPPKVRCRPNDFIIADPNNCANYYLCQFGSPISMTCPDGTIFDEKIGGCNFKEDMSCYANVELRCPGSDGLFEHPTHCGKYLNCYDFIPHVMNCPPGHWFDFFDPVQKTCKTRGVQCRPGRIQ